MLLILVLLAILGFSALTAIIIPPTLDGSSISIVNLYNQLTSPIGVLKTTLGDTPLAMKVMFANTDEDGYFSQVRNHSSASFEPISSEMSRDID